MDIDENQYEEPSNFQNLIIMIFYDTVNKNCIGAQWHIQTFNIYVVQIARRVHTIKNLKYYVNF